MNTKKPKCSCGKVGKFWLDGILTCAKCWNKRLQQNTPSSSTKEQESQATIQINQANGGLR